MGSAGIVCLMGMCELKDCLIREVLVWCGYLIVGIGRLSYMGSVGIVWLLEGVN
jgi:hypothetical protein